MKKLIMATLAAAMFATVFAAASVFAAPATWDQTVQVQANSVITITTDSAPNPATISADPTVNGGFGTVEVPLSVSSNNASGYNVTLSMIASDTNNGALFDSTAATTDTVAGIASAGTLTANTWGYNAIVGSTNTAPTNASTFSRVPASSSPVTLLTASAAGSSNFFVNFGAVVDYTLQSGITYSNQVTYTASVNP